MAAIKVTCNLYGNWNGYIGANRVENFGTSEFDAIEWLGEKLKTGDYKLSEKSDIKEKHIAEQNDDNKRYTEHQERINRLMTGE